MRHNHLITPDGTSDLLFSECVVRRAVEKAVCKLFARSGYSEVRTPVLEFYDVFDLDSEPIPQERMYKLTDNKGRLLVMRPDNTMPIARMVSTKLKNARMPLRLYYNQPFFRINDSLHGGADQIGQVGIELIGVGGLRADLEVLTIAVSALAECTQSYRLEIGHAGIFKALVASLPVDELHREQIRRNIESKNYAALSAQLDLMEQTEAVRALRQLPRLFGGIKVLEKARELISDETVGICLDRLGVVYNALSEMGYGDKLIIDLGLVHQNDYYSGLVFSAYAEGSGVKILSGGRYDNLLGCFGADNSACGFAINIDDLVKTLNPSEFNLTTAPERLVVAEGGKEIDALRYMGQLQSTGVATEFCLLEDIGDAMSYARDRGIKHVDIVTDDIETVEPPEENK